MRLSKSVLLQGNSCPVPNRAVGQTGWMDRRRLVIGQILVLLISGSCVWLGFWQLRRLDERQQSNAQIEAALKQPVLQAPEGGFAYRRARLTGRYDTQQFKIDSRSFSGRAGFNVVTPLVYARDKAILVDRGWVPLGTDAPQAPTGEVTVTGVLMESERPAPLTPKNSTLRINIVRIGKGLDYPVQSLYLKATDDEATGFPRPIPMTKRDEGAHFSYAIQWFSFAVLAWVVWILRLRKR